MKTTHLELRPIFVRKTDRTKGHVFVVMLAYLITQELHDLWGELDMTVAEGLDELGSHCLTQVTINSQSYTSIPQPNSRCSSLYKSAHIKIPTKLPTKTTHNKPPKAPKSIALQEE